MADRHPDDRSDDDGTDGEPSVFDLFEPPPSNDPNSFGKVPVIKDPDIDLTDTERQAAADVEAAGLQHWTAPPTGQVPAVLSEKDPKAGLWGDVAGPSWHGDDPTWSGPDLADVFADADAIRIDDDADEEDDEEEDEDYRRPVAPRPVRSRPPQLETAATPPPAERATTPPLAAAPERRQPPAERSWPAEESPSPRRPSPLAGDRPAESVPQLRQDPASAPGPRPGASEDRPTWPTSPDPQPTFERADASTEQPMADPDRARPPRRSALGRQPEPKADPQSRAPQGRAPQPGQGSERIPSIDDIEFAEPERAARLAAGRTSARQAERPRLEPDRSRPETDRPPAARLRERDQPRDLDRHEHDYDEGYDDEGYDDDFDLDDPGKRSAGRNLPVAIGVGLAFAAVVLAAIRFGPETTLLLVVVVAVVGVVELYNAMRLAGLRPANLLGIVGTAAAPAAAYYRGDAAFPLIVGLAVVFGFLWYLVGADSERPVLNLSLTMMGILWIGGLAGFAGLMLRADNGVDLLLAAIIITVASDTMAYFGGRAYGRRPFHPASPKKTWEGTITGFMGAVFAGFAIGVAEMGTLWNDNLVAAIGLGAIVGLLAPVGDLAESVVKRDLGIKDMGHILPGHGGVLDRVDALLFTLPGAYYLALVSGLI